VNWRRRAGKVVDLVYLEEERVDDVVADYLESSVSEQVLHVAAAAGEEIVDAQDVVSFLQQTFAEVTSEESCAARDEYALHCRSRSGCSKGFHEDAEDAASPAPFRLSAPAPGPLDVQTIAGPLAGVNGLSCR
jgi:hypothetical protein